MKKILLFVSTDVYTDQRVIRTSTSLWESGYKVMVVGRRKNRKANLDHLPFHCNLIKLPINKGPLFYFLFNIAIFSKILTTRCDIVIANDLDTLPGCSLGSWIKHRKMLYDSHELFTEVPELIGRNFTKKTWALLEKVFITKADAVTSVCDSISKELSRRYKKPCTTIRNVPSRTYRSISTKETDYDNKILLYQGATNKHRGIEELIGSLKNLDNSYSLVIAGDGDLFNDLRKLSVKLDVQNRIHLLGRINPDELRKITEKAFIGFSIEKATCMSYTYALPNKLFDYINAEIPVIVSNLPEMTHIVTKYDIGLICGKIDSDNLAKTIKQLSANKEKYAIYKENCREAADDLCWEKEKTRLLNIIEKL